MTYESDPFKEDLFPGKPKILFVGLPYSSHTHSWIKLLEGSEFNIRLFSSTGGIPPEDWQLPTYIIDPHPPYNIHSQFLQSLYPLPEIMEQYNDQNQKYHLEEIEYLNRLLEYKDLLVDREKELGIRIRKLHIRSYINEEILSINSDKAFHSLNQGKNPYWFVMRAFRKALNLNARRLNLPALEFDFKNWGPKVAGPLLPSFRLDLNLLKDIPPEPTPPVPPQCPSCKAETAEAWLAAIIKDWKPDIIHTLGIFDLQGGEFYFRARKNYNLENYGKWIIQLRGGSDLTLRHNDPELRPLIKEMFESCTQILSDNYANVRYALDMGIPSEKFPSIVPIPGTGGIDIETLHNRFRTLPSKRERIILVAKSYEAIWSKITPVLEALRIAWESIQPCKIVFTAVGEEANTLIKNFPPEIRENCTVHDRIDREAFLAQLGNARVLLSPSLIDGVPNVLYEAMACGTFPIVSPLKTIQPLVHDGENVLFARNLYPEEIAQAIITAMSNDEMVDAAYRSNYVLVQKYADRKELKTKIIHYYQELTKA